MITLDESRKERAPFGIFCFNGGCMSGNLRKSLLVLHLAVSLALTAATAMA
jgi:hypothetical protein